MKNLESTILQNLLFSDSYRKQVFPYLKKEYFESIDNKLVFELVHDFISKYEKCPTKESLEVDLQNKKNITEEQYKNASVIIDSFTDDEVNLQWMVDSSETWCRNRAIYLSLLESIKIADGQDEKKSRDSIPSILQDALAVSFDNHIGHDYLNDYEQRYETYHRK